MSVAALYLSEEERDDLRLTTYPEGTVIFPKRGGAILTNKKRMLSRPSCFDLNTMGVINTLRSISTDYLWHWFQKLDLSRIYDGSNVPQINNKNVEPLPFPLCSLAEQKEIVEILEEKLSVVGQLRLDIELELEKAEALRHSILKKAFSGKLVAQDPDDEPASILLERIKAEKAETENGKMKIKRTAAA
jgi:type I restriction enzyme S subunit